MMRYTTFLLSLLLLLSACQDEEQPCEPAISESEILGEWLGYHPTPDGDGTYTFTLLPDTLRIGEGLFYRTGMQEALPYEFDGKGILLPPPYETHIVTVDDVGIKLGVGSWSWSFMPL